MTNHKRRSIFFAAKMTFRQIMTSRKILPFAVIIVLVGIGLGAGKILQNPTAVTPDDNGANVVLSAIILPKTNHLTRSTTFSGRVESIKNSQIGFQRGGLITELNVDEGDQVSAKQVIASLDSRLVRAQKAALEAKKAQAVAVLKELNAGPRKETLDAAYANVEDLTEQLRAQELRLKRAEGLVEQKAISNQDYESALYNKNALAARLKLAEAQLAELKKGTRQEKKDAQQELVNSIQAEIDAAQVQLDDCSLVAPFDGVITARLFDEGAVIATGAPVFEIVDPKNLELHVGIPESASSKLEIGATVPVRAGEASLQAELKTILPKMDERTRTRKAIFEIATEDAAKVVPGQLAQVQLTRAIPEDGFWIPSTAITSSEKGLWTCYTIKPNDPSKLLSGSSKLNGEVRRQSVEVLYRDDDRVFVKGTIKQGQILIASGIHKIVPGSQVSANIESPVLTSDDPSIDGDQKD